MQRLPAPSPQEKEELVSKLLGTIKGRTESPLLRFLFEQHCLNPLRPIGEREISSALFNRDLTDENAQVRTAINRLRKKLDAYFRKSGARSAIRVSIPLSRYVLEFLRVQTCADPIAWFWGAYLENSADPYFGLVPAFSPHATELALDRPKSTYYAARHHHRLLLVFRELMLFFHGSGLNLGLLSEDWNTKSDLVDELLSSPGRHVIVLGNEEAALALLPPKSFEHDVKIPPVLMYEDPHGRMVTSVRDFIRPHEGFMLDDEDKVYIVVTRYVTKPCGNLVTLIQSGDFESTLHFFPYLLSPEVLAYVAAHDSFCKSQELCPPAFSLVFEINLNQSEDLPQLVFVSTTFQKRIVRSLLRRGPL